MADYPEPTWLLIRCGCDLQSSPFLPINKEEAFFMARFAVAKGSTSVAFLGMVVFLIALSVVLVSGVGYNPSDYNTGGVNVTQTQTGSSQIIVTETPAPGYSNLQYRTFGLITVPPSPSPAASHGCQGAQYNTESEILVGSDPAPNGTIGSGGKIRVWVVDEGAPHIAAGEVVDTTTDGHIITPGDRAQRDVGTDGNGQYIWAPSLYITSSGESPLANGFYSGDAENNGKPYFPNFIKGVFNNSPKPSRNSGVTGVDIDPDYTYFENGPDRLNKPAKPITDLEDYPAEYIWDVNSLGLAPGSYRAEFVIHDGDRNIAIDCFIVSI
jgi:hypothetical protein